MVIFKDRKSAGMLLAEKLHKYKARKDVLVLGIPRGGVVVAYEIAKALKLPLDIVITRKISDPHQPELALGAVDPKGEVVWNNELLKQLELKIKSATLADKIDEEVKEIQRREKIYRQGKKQLDIMGKTVLLIDDGIATGQTVLSAVKYLTSLKAKKIVVVAPVGASDSISLIESAGAETLVAFPVEKEDFMPVSSYYQNFEAVADKEVVQLLK